MIIQDHNIRMSSSHSLLTHHETSEDLEAWQGNNRVRISGKSSETQANAQLWKNPSDLVDISKEALDKIRISIPNSPTPTKIPTIFDVSDTTKTSLMDDEDSYIPFSLRLAQMLLEKIFGIKIDLIDPNRESTDAGNATAAAQEGQTQQPQAQGWGLRYTYNELKYEKEMAKFSAEGEITTGDGKKINFNMNMEMSREKLEQVHVEIKAGDALIDPLALNLDGMGVRLTDQKFQFDLNSDGTPETISFLTQGSAFLVLDKNQNGLVDDGSELFGPSTDNGFNELQTYDQDQNEWIDEKDPIFYQLNLWTKDANGIDSLLPIQQFDIGAIYTKSTQTPLNLDSGQLKETGLYLTEDGNVHAIQEVELAT